MRTSYRPRVRHVFAIALVLASSCARGDNQTNQVSTKSQSYAAVSGADLSQAVRVLSMRRVYFGHQSVGGNIIAGVEQLLRTVDGGSTLRVAEARDPRAIAGPALLHFAIGQNENPASKNADFLRVLDARTSRDSAIVMMKYCYIDVNPATNPDTVFAAYQALVAEVRARHPDVTLVHVTMPLTTDASGASATLRRLLGRTTARELNQKRSHYNDLLRSHFASEPVFDLAALEATGTDGSVHRVERNGQWIYALAPELTMDGGHLNDLGQRRVAEQFVATLASIAQRAANGSAAAGR